MPISEIVLRGISRAISDINTPDGGTSELINAVVENNEIRPSRTFENTGVQLGGGLEAVHSIDGNNVYISLYSYGPAQNTSNVLQFYDASGQLLHTYTLGGPCRNTNVAVIGNVVVWSSTLGTYYFLYKGGTYVDLGQRPPFPKLQFSVSSAGSTRSAQREAMLEYVTEENSEGTIQSDESLRSINTTAQAMIDTFLSDCRKSGRFVFPFFVRYALRLKDGSGHILHSAPILVNPSTDKAPFSVEASNPFTSALTTKLTLRSYSTKLEYSNLMSETEVEKLQKWGDIVSHIDIFASAPIYSYKELTPDFKPETQVLGGVRTHYFTQVLNKDYGWAALREGGVSVKNQLYTGGVDTTVYEVTLPEYSREQQYEEVKNTSLFYRISSIPLSDLPNLTQYAWNEVAIEENTLDTLVNMPVLRDDFNSHATKYASSLEVYNQRLIMAGMHFKPYKGYPLSTVRPYVEDTGRYMFCGDSFDLPIRTATTLRKDGAEITVYSEDVPQISTSDALVNGRQYGFYYYPDVDAKTMVIPTYQQMIADQWGAYKKVVELTPHTGFNGAYKCLRSPNFGVDLKGATADWPLESSSQIYAELEEVYQSTVGNPFTFPLDGIMSVGNTPIIAIIASSIEVSTGQFGDFPAYAFASDGVWMLRINEEGWLSSPQLLSNDVCFGRDAIAALNRPVVFGSNRGLMLIEGSKITCLSDALAGPRFPVSDLPDITSIPDEFSTQLGEAKSNNAFMDFLKSSRMVYDYAQNRLLIMSDGGVYAYVLSLSSMEFSKVAGLPTLESPIVHYSGIYSTSKGNSELYKLATTIDVEDDTTEIPVIAITRPIKFGTMGLKCVKRVLTRHTCTKPVKMIIYGSRDGETYHRVTSLRGRSYRYFIFALFGKMTPQEKISCISVDWETRFTNKLR